jgi:hypothetical protein
MPECRVFIDLDSDEIVSDGEVEHIIACSSESQGTASGRLGDVRIVRGRR